MKQVAKEEFKRPEVKAVSKPLVKSDTPKSGKKVNEKVKAVTPAAKVADISRQTRPSVEKQALKQADTRKKQAVQ